MPIFKDSLRDEFPEYDFGIIEQRASELEPEERFSQAREAKKLKPVISAIVTAHPHASAAVIADILAAARAKEGGDLGPTFRREVGALVRTIKADVKNGSGDATGTRADSQSSRGRRITRERQTADAEVPSPALIGPAAAAPVAPDLSPRDFPIEVSEVPLFGARNIAAESSSAGAPPGSAPPAAPAPAAGADRPYPFTGKFAGMVFKHGSELRNFFSAVQKDVPVQQIAHLVGPVLASPAAQAKLGDLEPADRAIFEAMVIWAKDHGI